MYDVMMTRVQLLVSALKAADYETRRVFTTAIPGALFVVSWNFNTM